MQFAILGPLEVRHGADLIPITAPMLKAVLVVLLLRRNHVVSVDDLIDQLWGDRPPPSARVTVRNYIRRLRRILPGCVHTRAPGYVLRTGPDQLDLDRFDRLVADASQLRRDEPRAAAEQLRAAIDLWRGPALADLPAVPVQRVEGELLEERRLTAVRDWLDVEIGLGRQATLLEELQRLVRDHPLREWTHHHLIRALYADGRRDDALLAYRRARSVLVEQLGVEPGPELQELHRQVLDGDPLPPPTTAGAGDALVDGSVPRQLPSDISTAVGRHAELDRLDELLRQHRKDVDRPPVVVAITGMAGVGKTTLAVHWAHRICDEFPDGQLYVDLRGFHPSGSPMDPGAAVRTFLESLGVNRQRIPESADAQTALYRSKLAGRRVLIVLDNARDSGHLRPLLPAESGCLVVVTSRRLLAGLVATDAAQLVSLDVLPDREARDFLAVRVGRGRVAAEPDAVDEILACCGRLPLALAIAAARASTRPHLPLARIMAELRAGSLPLWAHTGDDHATDLVTVFSWSYRILGPEAARLFRLLGLHPGPDLSLPAAVSLAERSTVQLRPLLEELVTTQLLIEHSAGRFTFHDLLREYAAEQSNAVDRDDERQAVARRMLDHYVHTAYAADRLLDPQRDPLTLEQPEPGVAAERITDGEIAMAWFDQEHQVLIAAIEYAVNTGNDRDAWQLAWALTTYLNRTGRWHDLVAVGQFALTAVRRTADLVLQARVHRYLALAHVRLGDFDRGDAELRQALDLAERAADPVEQAHAHLNFGYLADTRGHGAQALESALQALHLYEQAGHVRGRADMLGNVGWCYAQVGEYAQAISYSRRSLALHEQLADQWGQAISLDSLGYSHFRLGDHEAAVAFHEQALDLYRVLDDRYMQANTLQHLGDAHHAAGDDAAAHAAYTRALAVLDDLEHPDAEVVRGKLAELDR